MLVNSIKTTLILLEVTLKLIENCNHVQMKKKLEITLYHNIML